MKKEPFHKKGLSFYCQQSIDDFEKVGNKLHCQQCGKNIIDFRNKNKSDYKQIIKSEKEVCGIFYANQIGDEIDITINWKKPFLLFSFFGSMFISQPLLAQNTTAVKTEITDSTYTKSSVDTTISCSKRLEEDVETNTKKTKSTYHYKNKKRLYISKYFPFLHYDRKRTKVTGAPERFWK